MRNLRPMGLELKMGGNNFAHLHQCYTKPREEPCGCQVFPCMTFEPIRYGKKLYCTGSLRGPQLYHSPRKHLSHTHPDFRSTLPTVRAPYGRKFPDLHLGTHRQGPMAADAGGVTGLEWKQVELLVLVLATSCRTLAVTILSIYLWLLGERALPHVLST